MKINNSDRLQYQLMDENDGELLYSLDQNPSVMRFINGGKLTTHQELKDVLIPRMQSYRNPQLGWGLWKISDKTNQQFIGWVLVRPMHFFSDSPKYDDLELGWRFFESTWGQGYASEAAKHIITSFSKLAGVKFFSAIAVEDNIASIKVMKKLGMKFIKKGIHKDPLGDWDVVYFQRPAL